MTRSMVRQEEEGREKAVSHQERAYTSKQEEEEAGSVLCQ